MRSSLDSVASADHFFCFCVSPLFFIFVISFHPLYFPCMNLMLFSLDVSRCSKLLILPSTPAWLPCKSSLCFSDGSCSFLELMIHPVLTEQLAYLVALIEWGANDEIELQSTRSTFGRCQGHYDARRASVTTLVCTFSMSGKISYKTVRAYDLLHDLYQSVIQSSYTKTVLVDIFGSISWQYFLALLLLLVSFSCFDSQGRKVHWLSHWNLGQNEHTNDLSFFSSVTVSFCWRRSHYHWCWRRRIYV